MSGSDNFLVSILNAILRGEFLPDTELENELGFNEIDTATMKYNIRKGKINTKDEIKDKKSELYIMGTSKNTLNSQSFPQKQNYVIIIL